MLLPPPAYDLVDDRSLDDVGPFKVLNAMVKQRMSRLPLPAPLDLSEPTLSQEGPEPEPEPWVVPAASGPERARDCVELDTGVFQKIR